MRFYLILMLLLFPLASKIYAGNIHAGSKKKLNRIQKITEPEKVPICTPPTSEIVNLEDINPGIDFSEVPVELSLNDLVNGMKKIVPPQHNKLSEKVFDSPFTFATFQLEQHYSSLMKKRTDKEITTLADYQVENHMAIRELIANAIDSYYHQRRETSLHPGKKTVKIHTEQLGQRGLIRIEDEGIGMNLDDVLFYLLSPNQSKNEFLINASQANHAVSGRFGQGFFSVLSYLQGPLDSVTLKTWKRGEERPIEMTLSRYPQEHGGGFKVTLRELSESRAGTELTIQSSLLTNLAEIKNRVIRETFDYGQRAEISMDQERVNPPELLNRFLWHWHNPQGQVSFYALGSSLTGQGPLVQGSGSLSLVVNGITIQKIKVQGMNIYSEMVFNLPPDTKLTPDRMAIDLNDPRMIDFFHQILHQAIKDKNVTLINSLFPLIKDNFDKFNDLPFRELGTLLPALEELASLKSIVMANPTMTHPLDFTNLLQEDIFAAYYGPTPLENVSHTKHVLSLVQNKSKDVHSLDEETSKKVIVLRVDRGELNDYFTKKVGDYTLLFVDSAVSMGPLFVPMVNTMEKEKKQEQSQFSNFFGDGLNFRLDCSQVDEFRREKLSSSLRPWIDSFKGKVHEKLIHAILDCGSAEIEIDDEDGATALLMQSLLQYNMSLLMKNANHLQEILQPFWGEVKEEELSLFIELIMDRNERGKDNHKSPEELIKELRQWTVPANLVDKVNFRDYLSALKFSHDDKHRFDFWFQSSFDREGVKRSLRDAERIQEYFSHYFGPSVYPRDSEREIKLSLFKQLGIPPQGVAPDFLEMVVKDFIQWPTRSYKIPNDFKVSTLVEFYRVFCGLKFPDKEMEKAYHQKCKDHLQVLKWEMENSSSTYSKLDLASWEFKKIMTDLPASAWFEVVASKDDPQAYVTALKKVFSRATPAEIVPHLLYLLSSDKEIEGNGEKIEVPSVKSGLVPIESARHQLVREVMGEDPQRIKKEYKLAMEQNIDPYKWVHELMKNTLEAKATAVKVKMGRSADGAKDLTMEMEDNGQGVSPEEMYHFFIPKLSNKDEDKKDINFGWGFFTTLNYFDEVVVESSEGLGKVGRVALKKTNGTLELGHEIFSDLRPKGTRIYGRVHGQKYSELEVEKIKYLLTRQVPALSDGLLFNQEKIMVNNGQVIGRVWTPSLGKGAEVVLVENPSLGNGQIYYKNAPIGTSIESLLPAGEFWKRVANEIHIELKQADIKQTAGRNGFIVKDQETIHRSVKDLIYDQLPYFAGKFIFGHSSLFDLGYDFHYSFKNDWTMDQCIQESRKEWSTPQRNWEHFTKEKLKCLGLGTPLSHLGGKSLWDVHKMVKESFIKAGLFTAGEIDLKGNCSNLAPLNEVFQSFDPYQTRMLSYYYETDIVNQCKNIEKIRKEGPRFAAKGSYHIGPYNVEDQTELGLFYDELKRANVEDVMGHALLAEKMNTVFGKFMQEALGEKEKVKINFYYWDDGSGARARQGQVSPGKVIEYNTYNPSFRTLLKTIKSKKYEPEHLIKVLNNLTHEMVHVYETPGLSTHDENFFKKQQINWIKVQNQLSSPEKLMQLWQSLYF